MPLVIRNTCPMYKLKNLHEEHVNVFNKSDKDINDEIQLSDQEIDLLIKKQNEVLKTLDQLEVRLSKLDIQFPDLKNSVSVSDKQSNPLISCHVFNKNDCKISKSKYNRDITDMIKTDTVIFADPEDPPYSLLAVPVLWPAISWDISYHIHSSITIDLKALKTIELFKNVSCKDNKTVKVFVIWQHIKPSPKVVRSPTEALFGEVSLLRLFNQYFSTKKLIAANQTNSDKVLDLINEINCSVNDRTSELYNLINVSSTKLNIENIAIWSLLYKKNKSPPNIEKWLTVVSKIIFS